MLLIRAPRGLSSSTAIESLYCEELVSVLRSKNHRNSLIDNRVNQHRLPCFFVLLRGQKLIENVSHQSLDRVRIFSLCYRSLGEHDGRRNQLGGFADRMSMLVVLGQPVPSYAVGQDADESSLVDPSPSGQSCRRISSERTRTAERFGPLHCLQIAAATWFK